MVNDDTPTLPETLHGLDTLTEDLDQVITNLYTWRDQHDGQAVRDALAAIGDQLSGAWALLMHARHTVNEDLPASVRTAVPASTPAEAEAQADAALGRGRHRASGVSGDTPEWRLAGGYL